MEFGQPLLEFDSVESTNKTAAELVAAGTATHGAAILAHEQRDGQGQRNRHWQSVAGRDLTFSLVCTPKGLRADRQFALSKVAALAVHDALRERVQGDVRIKWPNDLLIEGRKAAGILIQCDVMGEHVGTAIVGIGLNVNSAAFPHELAATSLLLETRTEHPLREVLQRVLERFGHWWRKWESAPEAGLQTYTDRLWTRGRWAPMVLDGTAITARALDVDEQGRLLIEAEDGSVAAYGLDRLRFAPRQTGLQT
ncbi:MAG: biotin--[acetyl-CoA-carboxylase] ligase [Flavobacteriales bacterium]